MKIYKFLILIAFLFLMISCAHITPRIKGVVLDKKTGEPVKGAWVSAWAETITKWFIIEGDIEGGYDLLGPHTRTNEKGEFVIPMNIAFAPLKIIGWQRITSIGISACTLDDRCRYVKFTEPKWREKLKKSKDKNGRIRIYVRPKEEYYKEECSRFQNNEKEYYYCIEGEYYNDVMHSSGK